MRREENTSERRGDDMLDVLFACLANRDRRRVSGILFERGPSPLTLRDLATYLTPQYRKDPLAHETHEQVQQALVHLHHIHLPILEAVGLIERAGETVTIADHPAYQDEGIVDVLGDGADADADSLDDLFSALGDHRRRTILDVLSHQFGPIHTETLARELGANEQEMPESEVPAEDVEERLERLYHVHLPHLAEAELITYDTDERMVAYRGHPALRVPWIHSVLGPDFRSSLTGESEPRELGTIRGRERVISFGQSLCERAQEELFCMFTDTDLLEAGCLMRIRDASRGRGTKVYLGTPNPTVQEYVRENAPEVVLWEPNTNWLNLPVAGNRVGRLLLADRDAVMLGTLGEKVEDGVHEEKSILGEGADNTLVVMVSQLLGPHLEQIDEGTEDIEVSLPF